MPTRQLTAEILDAAIEGFEARKLRIDEQIAQAAGLPVMPMQVSILSCLAPTNQFRIVRPKGVRETSGTLI